MGGSTLMPWAAIAASVRPVVDFVTGMSSVTTCALGTPACLVSAPVAPNPPNGSASKT